MARLLRNFVFACAVVLPCAVLVTEIVLYSQNSLYLNDRWIVQKRMMKMGVMGADEFLLTRTPLAQNLLNLGSYHGYQEVIYRQPVTLSQIEFRFQVEDGSYLDLTYNRNGAGYSGLRLSRREDMPSIVFESTEKGRLQSKTLIPVQAIGAGWHTASIRSSSSGLTVKIDQETSAIPTTSHFAAGLVGFRAGIKGARIDDVVIQPLTGPSFQENFRNSKNWPRIFACNVGLLLLFGALFSRVCLGKFWVATKEGLFHWTLISVVGLVCAGCWYLGDYFFYSKRVPRGLAITRLLFSKEHFSTPSFEQLRFIAFEAWSGLLGGETITHKGVADRGYPDHRIFRGPIYCGPAKEACIEGMPPATDAGKSDKSSTYRVLFIGSSQTIGAGAEDLEDTFFVRVHHYLSEAIAPKFHLESINLSVSSYRAEELLPDFKSRFRDFPPDLVVINLSFNDRDSPENFLAAMTGFLDFDKAAGIKTILLEEAYSGETDSPQGLSANHQVLRRLGRKYHVPVLPLHDFLSESAKLGNGTLWWDQVHLTSYGQELTAAWLAPQVLNILLTSRGASPLRVGLPSKG
ncbi:MAG TPA: SGNH/GDSL hydrolase family protein [Candidatus Acidoferrales bacterium]|nr:SGNH/GDSL hydrolase family protein [Candidatus Acidoferrales bacterium]